MMMQLHHNRLRRRTSIHSHCPGASTGLSRRRAQVATPALARRMRDMVLRRVMRRTQAEAEQQRAAADLEQQRQAEIEQELRLARDIQQGLLLEAVPHLPGWELSAISIPARDLGGDLYDFLPLGKAVHGVMIGDVSGKGLPAALRMAVARTVFRHEARQGDGPGCTLAAVNQGILREIPQGMVTMLYVAVDTAAGTLRFANAGHNYPVLVNSRVEEIELSGLPLGVDGDSEYTEVVTGLCPGDLVVLYTDGVTEATRPDGEMYGYERLRALLETHRSLKPRNLVAVLLHELRAWSPGSGQDDITVVVIRRRLERLGAELFTAVADVLDLAGARDLWRALPLPAEDAPHEQWAEALPQVVREAQARYGRGLARELNQQMRLVLEDYRT